MTAPPPKSLWECESLINGPAAQPSKLALQFQAVFARKTRELGERDSMGEDLCAIPLDPDRPLRRIRLDKVRADDLAATPSRP